MDVLQFGTTETPAGKSNLAGLDAVRVGATLGVVLLHSCVPYVVHPMPGLAWPVRDVTSPVVDVAFWTIELFIMPLFLIMSGFLAWRTLQMHGGSALFKSRCKRILKPLLFGAIVVLPLDLYSWLLGWVTEGLIAPVKLRSLKFDGIVDRDLWGLSHLWYLQYLFLYVTAVAVRAVVCERYTVLKRLQIQPRVLLLAGLVTATLILYVHPEVVSGFQHSFFPVASKWFYSGLFFCCGLVLAQHDRDLSRLPALAIRMVIPAVLISIAAVVLGRWHLASATNPLARLTLSVLTCSSALLLSLSILGCVVGRLQQVPLSIRYLSAASFWVYLAHHPIVGLVHVDLKWLMSDSHAILKAGIAFSLTSGFCLLCYESIVRRSALGRWLGMSWRVSRPFRSLGAIPAAEHASDGIDRASPTRKAPRSGAWRLHG